MKKHLSLIVGAAFGVLAIMVLFQVREAQALDKPSKDFVPPIVFQAAGPTVASIQSSFSDYQAKLGANNGNA
ncbi:MAG TPA: hypothetical protein VFB82_10440, partial [Blastocatellia bacterium]|nr:hypothetical protein [Blastocatellia bacterium]